MNRYFRFTPMHDGRPNTVEMTLGDDAPPAIVRACALQRLRVLLGSRTICEGCEFVAGEEFPAELLEQVKLDLFPTALNRLTADN
jgi:hypothetical protein